jgi:hypothetical protein
MYEFICLILTWTIFGLVILFIWTEHAPAHDWYSALKDPTTNKGCCGGTDCAQVPQEMIDSGAVTPVADGFAVRLTWEQARHFNKSTKTAVAEHVPWARVLPDQSKDPNGTGYALCIIGGTIQCFFAPQGY